MSKVNRANILSLTNQNKPKERHRISLSHLVCKQNRLTSISQFIIVRSFRWQSFVMSCHLEIRSSQSFWQHPSLQQQSQKQRVCHQAYKKSTRNIHNLLPGDGGIDLRGRSKSIPPIKIVDWICDWILTPS